LAITTLPHAAAETPSEPPVELLLEFPDNRLLIELCGEFDRNLAQIEHLLSVHILRRGNEIALLGDARAEAAEVVQALYDRLEAGKSIEPGDIDAAVRMGVKTEETGARDGDQMEMFGAGALEIGTRKKTVEPRTPRRPTTCATSSSTNWPSASARRAPARPISPWPSP
jgi:phosphate starvation-inducible PhoH-like protein